MTSAASAVGLVRRCLVVPLIVATETVIVLCAPLIIGVAGLASRVDPRARPVRIARLVVAYAVCELAALRELLDVRRDSVDGEQAYYALVGRFLQRLYYALGRTVGIRLEVTDDSPGVEEVRAAAPLVVLSRHAGPGDSFLLVWLLLVRWGLRPRIVMRKALQWEPTIDIVGHAVPNCFVRRGSGRNREAIRFCASTLGPSDALLLFPEGGNFTRRRRLMRIASLRARRHVGWARRARRMRNVIAPHTGGALAALDAAPAHARVLLIAHTGLSPKGQVDRPWWDFPVDVTVRAHAWLLDPDALPRGDAERERWLFDQWARIDAWVEANA